MKELTSNEINEIFGAMKKKRRPLPPKKVQKLYDYNRCRCYNISGGRIWMGPAFSINACKILCCYDHEGFGYDFACGKKREC